MIHKTHFFWYLVGGLLLLLAGLVALEGITFPYAVPLMLMIAGAVIVIAALAGYRPSFPAFVIFLVGIVAFGLAASGPYAFTPFTTTETFELTRGQVSEPFERMTVLCSVSTGSITLSFSSNDTSIYRLVFTKYSSFLHQPVVDYNYSIENGELILDTSSTTVSADITLNKNIACNLNLTTSTGSVRVTIPATATKVNRMTLKATTGEVFVNMTNTESLERLAASTTTGQVEAHIKSSFQTKNARVTLSTTTGRVELNMNITHIECDITASTVTGSVNDYVTGFTVLINTRNDYRAQTPDYNRPAFRKLDVTATTTTGSVDITAHHA